MCQVVSITYFLISHHNYPESWLSADVTGLVAIQPQPVGLVAFPCRGAVVEAAAAGRTRQCPPRPPAGKAAVGTSGPSRGGGRGEATAVEAEPGDCAPAGPTRRRGREEGRRGAGRAGRDGGGAAAPAARARRAEEVPLRELRASGGGALGAVGERSPERGAPVSPPPPPATRPAREPAAPAADGVYLSGEPAGEAGARERSAGRSRASPRRCPPARELRPGGAAGPA